jgi:Family of unknown function (DUF6461)
VTGTPDTEPMDDLSSYEWTDEIEAISLTLVQQADLTAVLRLTEVDPDSSEEMTFDDVLDLEAQEERRGVQIETLGYWTAVIEPNGYRTSLAEVLAPLSAGGRAVNVFWNVNAVMSFGLAVDGAMVREFDPVLAEQRVGTPLPEEAGLELFSEDTPSQQACMMLLERITGVKITQDWLDASHPTWTGAAD